MIYQFEDLTIRQLKELTEQFMRENPEFETPKELLEHKQECSDGIFE